MIYDGISLIEGSALQNLVIASGTAFPSGPDVGELFVRTDAENSGLYVYQNSAWTRLLKVGDTIDGVGTAGGVSSSVQYNNAGTLDGALNMLWSDATRTLTLGDRLATNGSAIITATDTGTGNNGRALTVSGGNSANGYSTAGGGALNLFGGDGTGISSFGGSVTIRGGASTDEMNGGAVTVQGGTTEGSLSTGDAGSVLISGGYVEQTGGYGDGGSVTIRAGLRGPNANAAGGTIIFQTSTTQSQVERFRILADGSWSVGVNGNNVGFSGQVLTSQGAGAAPIWATPESSVSNDIVTLSTTQTITADKTFAGALMVGTTVPIQQSNDTSAALMVASTATAASRLSASIFRNDANSAGITFTKSRGASIGTHALVQNGDGLGFIPFEGSTGSAYARGATISVTVDGTASSTSMPANIKLSTTPSGSTTPVERLTINASGSWTINSSTGTSGQVLISNGSGSTPTWQDLPNPSKLERVTTFDSTARGKRVALSAGVTIPAATYAAGDAFSFYNSTASAVTITQGSGLTLRQDGTANTGNRTLAAYGTCFVWFNTATEAIISGSLT